MAVDGILNFSCYFSEKIKLAISREESAEQTIHTKCQALFSMKNIKMSSAAVVISTLRAKRTEIAAML